MRAAAEDFVFRGKVRRFFLAAPVLGKAGFIAKVADGRGFDEVLPRDAHFRFGGCRSSVKFQGEEVGLTGAEKSVGQNLMATWGSASGH